MAANSMSGLLIHDLTVTDGIFQVAVTSMGNAIQAYTTLSYTRRLYAGQPPTSTSSFTKTTKTTTTVSETTAAPAATRPTVQDSATTESHTSPVTPLSARTFGTWTFLVGVVRIYAAYHNKREALVPIGNVDVFGGFVPFHERGLCV